MSDVPAIVRLLAADAAAGRPAADPQAWYAYVEAIAETLDVGPGTAVFDATCGAGAFLLPLAENGYRVGGMDRHEANVALARAAMPRGRFLVGRSVELDPADPWQVVLISQGFTACAGADDVRSVVARMVAKATYAVALLSIREDGAGDGPAVPRTRLLRWLVEQGAAAVRFEDGEDGTYRALARV